MRFKAVEGRSSLTAGSTFTFKSCNSTYWWREKHKVITKLMSLYWHVKNKEDVLDVALDAVLEYRGALQVVEPRNWRGIRK